MSRRSLVSAEDFIRAWQTSESLIEVAQKLNIERHLAYSRAAYYRRKGVPLKVFPDTNRRTWQPLIELAASLESGADMATESLTRRLATEESIE